MPWVVAVAPILGIDSISVVQRKVVALCQQSNHHFAFQQGQMLAKAIARACNEREKCKGLNGFVFFRLLGAMADAIVIRVGSSIVLVVGQKASRIKLHRFWPNFGIEMNSLNVDHN